MEIAGNGNTTARLAFCGDEEIVVSPAFGFGAGGVGEAEEAAMREAMDAVVDEDDFFFAGVDFAAAAGRVRENGTDSVEERTPARKRAPLGFFDMTADEQPLPSIGVVVAKNASSRDAALFAMNEEGEVVAKKWPKGGTVTLRDGKLDERRPASPEGKVAAYVPYLYPVAIAYERDDGTRAVSTRFDVDVETVELRKVEEEDFPLAFVSVEIGNDRIRGKYERRREIRSWGGTLWSSALSGRPAHETTTVARLERVARLSVAPDFRAAADSTVERDAVALAKEARLLGKEIRVVEDGRERGRDLAERRLTQGKPTIVRGNVAWREIGEPHYAVVRGSGKTYVCLSDWDPDYRDSQVLETLPLTMSKEEALEYVRSKYGGASWIPATDYGIASVEVVDPKYVKVRRPTP